jgi:hypothetical protein
MTPLSRKLATALQDIITTPKNVQFLQENDALALKNAREALTEAYLKEAIALKQQKEFQKEFQNLP